jgi:hypothetical protein
MSGKGAGELDGDMDIDISMYYTRRNVIGYTYGGLRTWINRKYFNQFDEADICGNVAHEYAHKCGFTHAKRYNRTRYRTIPYAVGYKIRDIVNEMMGMAINPPVIKPKRGSRWSRFKSWLRRVF